MDWRRLIVRVAVPECPTATLNCITPRLFASPNPSSKPPLWGKCRHCHGNVPSLPSPTWEFWRNRGRKITSVVRHPYIHRVININFVQHWHVCPLPELHAVKSVPLMPVNQHALAVCSVPNNHQQRFSQRPAGLNTSMFLILWISEEVLWNYLFWTDLRSLRWCIRACEAAKFSTYPALLHLSAAGGHVTQPSASSSGGQPQPLLRGRVRITPTPRAKFTCSEIGLHFFFFFAQQTF